MRLALGKDDVMQAQGMALLREATLPPEAHDEVQNWLHTSQQTVRPLCEKAGQDQASWLITFLLKWSLRICGFPLFQLQSCHSRPEILSWTLRSWGLFVQQTLEPVG